MSEILSQTEHRPWPVPQRRWSLAMRWQDLLFAHWPVRPEVLRSHIPSALEIDTWDGWAWIGIVPFRMTGVRHRLFPDRCSLAFPELNVRTYVAKESKPGVWFFSLDATNPFAVRAARAWYGLPYFNANMEMRTQEERIVYHSRRVHRRAAPAELQMEYVPCGKVFHAAPGTLEYWLIERYCLYARKRNGNVTRGDIHHPPWSLHVAEANISVNRMTEQIGLSLPAKPALLHFAKEQSVLAWNVRG